MTSAATRPAVQSFWNGTLSALERMAIRSFLHHGYSYHLYVYGDVRGCPPGVVLMDANAVLPQSWLFLDSRGTYAGFSDLFRYKLLLERGGWWVDTDMVCLAPIEIELPLVLAREPDGNLGSAIMRMPRGCELAQRMWKECAALDRDNFPWGAAGPALLARVADSLGATDAALDPIVFYPFDWSEWQCVLDPAARRPFDPRTKTVHLWNSMWALAGKSNDESFPPGCLYEELKQRYPPGEQETDTVVRSPTLAITAILAAFNEADVIRQVVLHLIDQGIRVHLLDDNSTDGTADAVRDLEASGLLQIESFTGRTHSAEAGYPWAAVLRRKEEIAAGLVGGWVIHQDADEIRESPWPELSLADGIRLVDGLGYDAIDFDVLNFWPTDMEDYRPGDDLRTKFPRFEPALPCDKLQVKCWKQPASRVDLTSLGGHDVTFAGRQVYPIRFLLRHYPVRSQAHGVRKVFTERLGRFPEAERARGWHIQYDDYTPETKFVRAPDSLERFDPYGTRATLLMRHRGVEALERDLTTVRDAVAELGRAAHEREIVVQELHVRVRRLQRSLEIAEAERTRSSAAAETERTRLVAEIDQERRVTRLFAMLSKASASARDRAEALEKSRLAGMNDERANGVRAVGLRHLLRTPNLARRARAISTSGLFDEAYYLSRYPDLASSRLSPLAHFLLAGGREGRNPHWLFDTGWYLSQQPNIPADIDPLSHFLQAAEDIDPHPLFSIQWCRQQVPTLPRGAATVVQHYLSHSWLEGLTPHPLFDPAFYMEEPVGVPSRVNPLRHYLEAGFREGRRPHALFDPQIYVAAHPDAAGTNPLLHYLRQPVNNRRDTHPLFDAAYYVREYPDVAAAGADPLIHFIQHGGREGRNPNPFFDSAYYLSTNPDVAAVGANPLVHFVRQGWFEGRNPSARFDLRAYLRRHQDVLESGQNPLEHYLQYGEAEGRSID